MICSNCGNDNKDNAKFCFKCGAKLASSPQPSPVIEIQPAVVSPATNLIQPESIPIVEDLSTRPLVMASLLFKEDGNEIHLPFKDIVIIGRTDKQNGIIPDIDLSQLDKNKIMSRRHGCIQYSDSKYRIMDMGSMNGTFLNGTKLESNKEYTLKNGDEITFGKMACIFNCVG